MAKYCFSLLFQESFPGSFSGFPVIHPIRFIPVQLRLFTSYRIPSSATRQILTFSFNNVLFIITSFAIITTFTHDKDNMWYMIFQIILAVFLFFFLYHKLKIKIYLLYKSNKQLVNYFDS